MIYAQIHVHSKFSVNPLSGEGVIHRYVWPIERLIIKSLMFSPEKIYRNAKKLGLRFVCITDHNTVPKIEENFRDVLIPSEEWGQKKGHSNFISLFKPIDPDEGFFKKYKPKDPKDFLKAFENAKKQGAFIVINHPFKRDAWLWGMDSYSYAHAIEVWNGPWNPENSKALNLWQNLLENGIRIYATAGNDFHINFLHDLDKQLIVIKENVNEKDFLDKLKNGQFSIVKDRFSPSIFLHDDLTYEIENYKKDLTLKIISKKFIKKIQNPEVSGKVHLEFIESFVRLELWLSNDPQSFTNPIFLKVPEQ